MRFLSLLGLISLGVHTARCQNKLEENESSDSQEREVVDFVTPPTPAVLLEEAAAPLPPVPSYDTIVDSDDASPSLRSGRSKKSAMARGAQVTMKTLFGEGDIEPISDQCSAEEKSIWMGVMQFSEDVKDFALSELGNGDKTLVHLQRKYPTLGDLCGRCFAQNVSCGAINCSVECALGPFTKSCVDCTDIECNPQLRRCIGAQSDEEMPVRPVLVEPATIFKPRPKRPVRPAADILKSSENIVVVDTKPDNAHSSDNAGDHTDYTFVWYTLAVAVAYAVYQYSINKA
jgi:hypothetical protein